MKKAQLPITAARYWQPISRDMTIIWGRTLLWPAPIFQSISIIYLRGDMSRSRHVYWGSLLLALGMLFSIAIRLGWIDLGGFVSRYILS